MLRTTLCCCLFFLPFIATQASRAEEAIDFSSQVRPILSDKCFHCHGPDAQNQDSEFRADTQENLFADLGGYAAVVPGDIEGSELHTRIHSDDPDMVMPPVDSNRSLTAEQKRILDLWIKQGAPYEAHWSFIPPQRPSVPSDRVARAVDEQGWDKGRQEEWSQNPIDAFIADRLVGANLQPSPQADDRTLLRRASLTLTGLLPPDELQAAAAANDPAGAYEYAVDRLLESNAYAERQALLWLDAARYADTDGYQNDFGRTNWPWRDWVIKAFRDNMPFDQFTIEQLAGDMLPDAGVNQRLASAFNRNHRQNAEGGALAAEFSVENIIDRVETTSTVWLGLTMGCCRCHDHKYDPLSQKEFYQLYGYFNNIGERGIGRGLDANPTMQTVSPLKEIDPKWLIAFEEAKRKQREAENDIDKRVVTWATKLREEGVGPGEQGDVWRLAGAVEAETTGAGKLQRQEDETLVFQGEGEKKIGYKLRLAPTTSRVTVLKIKAMPDKSYGQPRRLAPSNNGNFLLTDLKVLINGEPVAISSAVASFAQQGHPATNAIDNDPNSSWGVFQQEDDPVELKVVLEKPLDLSGSDQLGLAMRFDSPYPGHHMGRFQVSLSERPSDVALLDPEILAIVAKSNSKWNNNEKKKLRDLYKQTDQVLQQATHDLTAAKRDLSRHGGAVVTVMVMNERDGKPATAYLLDRGQYDQPVKDDPLQRGVPEALLGDSEQPKDRLELAEWLVSRANPLTARVIVNRIWQHHFGVGLVKTSEDFGLQGETPSHPELLDWLAVEFIESGWDIKAMHRLILTSATFKQASQTNDQLKAADPTNRLLAHGPRYRADGFVIRDLALQASGLLNPTVGGPPVKPYQPTGLWEVVAANAGTRYKPSTGDALYRKSMYSYWKRAVNPPRQTIFDASGREVCNVQVRRTNTPLQALVLLNDPTFVESARKLSERVLQTPGLSDQQRLAEMYELAIARPATPQTLQVLGQSLAYFRDHYRAKPGEAEKLLKIGQSSRDEQLDAVEHAALSAVAHVILNLDEFITVE